MYLILRMIDKNIPILHEIIIKNDNLKVFILSELYLLIRNPKEFRHGHDKIRRIL